MRLDVVIAAALALAACGKAADGLAANEVNGAVPDLTSDRPRPGIYSVKLVDEFIGNDAPETKTSETTLHFTAADFDHDSWVATFLEGDQCRDRHLAIHDGSISGGMRCDFADLNLVDASVDLHGSYTKDGWDLSVDLTSDGITQRRNLTVRRVGD